MGNSDIPEVRAVLKVTHTGGDLVSFTCLIHSSFNSLMLPFHTIKAHKAVNI